MQPHHPSLSCDDCRIDATPPALVVAVSALAAVPALRMRLGIASVGMGLLIATQIAAAAEPAASPDPSVRSARPARSARHLRHEEARNHEATIRLLQERVDMLEARLNAIAPVAPPAVPVAMVPGRPDTAARLQSGAAVAQAGSATSANPSSSTTASPAAKAAGSFDIDEDAAQRALERTLTQSGALLLQPGTIEFSPGVQYARIEQTSPILLTLPPLQNGAAITSIAESRVRRNEFALRADVRIGLPMNAQAEFGLPLTRATAQQNNTFDPVTSKSATRLGDATLGLAKTFAREKGFVPDLIGRLTYNTGSGRNLSAPLSTGGGFQQLQAELIAVKRQDPLAFVASVAYARVFEKDGLKPGDATVVSLSSLLAASPATSLQMGFSQILRAKQRVGGLRLDGSDQTYGLLTLGATSILSRDLTLVTQFGIGVGGDAPKYTFNASLPILFR
ncbi:MAG: hypothetical protein H7234_07735 [Herminiimonas sp.]|nr:hypothetical protein [Herminiimonas sp.]